jgi:hypothetical protein
MLALLAHLRTGRWASVLPDLWLEALGLGRDPDLVAIPLVEPELVSQVGLVAPDREPMSVLVQALMTQANALNRKS